ncbi:MAG: hypothetical protein DWQ40_08780 [Actinobacteria bacterium]|nr:MAG: hypothetical protein DWQ40_08780 [Actinomycetota bacterium]
MKVALITQTLRANACAAYIAADDAHDYVIFTGDPGAFAQFDLPDTTLVNATSASPAVMDPTRASQAARRHLLAWMRGGTRVGRLAERVARKVRSLWRQTDETMREAQAHPLNSYLIDRLAVLEEAEGVEELVVFDVFDLPTALAFRGTSAIRLLVR